MKTVYLGLGSNVGERETHLQAALDALNAAGIAVKRVSPVYETEPMDLPGQRWFLNLVVEAETSLFPRQLLARLQRLERQLGRRPTVDKGPREIDIDILLFGSFVVRAEGLEIPHPRMHQRRFVLAPLADLAGDLRHPVMRQTVRQLLEATAGQTVRKVEFKPVVKGEAKT